jgi:sulfatase modifying factor 1
MFLRRSLSLTLAISFGLFTPHCLIRAQTAKGVKYALLVGCANYDRTQLRPVPHTVDDIEGFKKALLATGFSADHIVVLHDKIEDTRYRPLKANIVEELRLMLIGMRPEDMAVVAVSGHGLHYKGDKTGYFCPIDAKLDDKRTLIPMDGPGGIFDLLKQCKAKQKLLIVNACRNDPTSDVALAAQTLQLDDEHPEEVPEGIAAIYSCMKGQKSYYDPERKLSIFYDHLIRAWKGEYQQGADKVKLENVFEQVTLKTKLDANRTFRAPQVPEVRREYSGDWLIGDAAASIQEITNSIGMKLVYVPPGKFLMGAAPEEKDRADVEGPQHEVEIATGFYLGKFEATIAEFRRFVSETGYKTEAEKDGSEGGRGYDAGATGFDGPLRKYHWKNTGYSQGDRHPVANVTWNDAKAFCHWLSRKERKVYDLPTEAEWEYACRAGTRTAHFSGDDAEALVEVGNIADAAFRAKLAEYDWGIQGDDRYAFSAPVGRYRANAFGLHDMHGNVSEWCADWYEADYYSNSPAQDPQGPSEGTSHVLRGGSLYNSPGKCRSAYRDNGPPDYCANTVGFRVVCRTPAP